MAQRELLQGMIQRSSP